MLSAALLAFLMSPAASAGELVLPVSALDVQALGPVSEYDNFPKREEPNFPRGEYGERSPKMAWSTKLEAVPGVMPQTRWFVEATDSGIILTDKLTASSDKRKLMGRSDDFVNVDITKEGKSILVAHQRKAWVFDRETLKKTALDYKAENDILAGRFSPDGRFVALKADYRVDLFDASTGKKLRSFEGGNIKNAVFGPGWRLLAMGQSLFETATGSVTARIPLTPVLFEHKGHESMWMLPIIHAIEFSENGKLLASADGGMDASGIVIFDETGRRLYTLQDTEVSLKLGSFSAKGDWPIFIDPSGDTNRRQAYKPVNLRHALTKITKEGEAYAAASAKPWDFTELKATQRKKYAQELAALVKSNEPLRAPKGEFESTGDHQARIKKAQDSEDGLRKKQEDELQSIISYNETERKWRNTTISSKDVFFLYVPVQLGAYDADKEQFEISALGQVFYHPITRAEAPGFKAKAKDLAVEGRVMYKDAETARFLGATLRIPSLRPYVFPLERQGPLNAAPAARAAADLSLSKLTLSEPSDDGALDAEEIGKISFEARNAGPGPAYGVTAEVSVDGDPVPGLTVESRAFLSTLEPGESKTASVTLTASQEMPAGKVRLRVVLKEANGFDSKPVVLSFTTRAFKAPKLIVSRLEFQDGKGLRVLSKGTETRVILTVTNAGEGPARGVTASVDAGHPEIKIFGETSAALGVLAPGESRKAAFTALVTRRYEGPAAIPLAFALGEERSQFSQKPQLAIALDAEPTGPSVVSISARESRSGASTAESVEVPPSLEPGQRVLGEDDLAVVIGIERYSNVVAKSDYSHADAKLARAYLTALGLPERNVEFLGDDKATLSALSKTLGRWLSNRVNPRSRVIVYYSGHGAPQPDTGDAYLLPYDGDPNYLADTAYPLRRLYDTLGKLPAREVLVVLDSCFSGAGGRSVLAAGARPLVISKDSGALPANMTLLTATQGGQISTSSPERGHGLFTYHLLKAIKDGKTTTTQAFAQLQPKVEDEAKAMNVSQSPSLSSGSGRPAEGFRFRK